MRQSLNLFVLVFADPPWWEELVYNANCLRYGHRHVRIPADLEGFERRDFPTPLNSSSMMNHSAAGDRADLHHCGTMIPQRSPNTI